MTARVSRLLVTVVVGLGMDLSTAAAQPALWGPPVPSNLAVPAGHVPFLKGRADGTQNYICLPTPTSLTWRFVGPQATLFGPFVDRQIATHFLSPNPLEADMPRPSWQHSLDTSQVWGRPLASSTDPAFVEPGAIPWLLVEVVGAVQDPLGGSLLARTTFIQRVHTSGGVAPSATCSDVGATVMVPYATDYVFYRARLTPKK